MARNQVTLDDIERRLIHDRLVKIQEWRRLLLTLATGTLALLVSLQGSYLPLKPQAIYLLKVCWAALAISICGGLLGIHKEAQIPLIAVRNLRKDRYITGDMAVALEIERTNGIGYLNMRLLKIADFLSFAGFLTAVVSLVWFALLNVGAGKA